MAEKMEILVEKQRRGARSNQKLKILYLAKILLDNTDANHDITLQEIIDGIERKLRCFTNILHRLSLVTQRTERGMQQKFILMHCLA